MIGAAAAACVALPAYTSVLGGERAGFRPADEHKETEAAIRACGVPFVLLRNGWYTDNCTADLAGTVERGGPRSGPDVPIRDHRYRTIRKVMTKMIERR